MEFDQNWNAGKPEKSLLLSHQSEGWMSVRVRIDSWQIFSNSCPASF
jgi:hypothetical protein